MFAITDERIAHDSLSALVDLGFEPILLPKSDYLSKPVAGHTDMLIFIGFGRLFCHEKYYRKNSALIDRICALSGSELTLSNEPTGNKYPFDVLFNACIVGKRLICNEKTVSQMILNAALENGYEVINVPQGYTKCSVCVVSDNAIITADKAISTACAFHGIDVLTVSEGHVSLPPYDYGFIGGASGCFGDNVFFCGNISSYPDGALIAKFCAKHKKNAISLSDGELQDVGSLFFV